MNASRFVPGLVVGVGLTLAALLFTAALLGLSDGSTDGGWALVYPLASLGFLTVGVALAFRLAPGQSIVGAVVSFVLALVLASTVPLAWGWTAVVWTGPASLGLLLVGWVRGLVADARARREALPPG